MILFVFLLVAALVQGSFEAEHRQWREKRNEELRAEDGWLTVAGLFWLKEGSNSFGTGKGMNIVLPAGSAPENIGTLDLSQGVVTLRVADGVKVSVGAETVRTYEMRFEGDKQPPSFLVGSLKLAVIKRGERYGLRVRDKNSLALRKFKGLEWFPARESYRVTATFTPYDQPKEITIMNVLGDELKMKSPGLLTFTLDGKTYQLRPVMEEGDDQFFIIFRDQTAGKTTYGAGRYLYADLPVEVNGDVRKVKGDERKVNGDERKVGKVILDFNRAENPPCAFTPYATCPLPPRQNFLPIPIYAGERAFHLKSKKG